MRKASSLIGLKVGTPELPNPPMFIGASGIPPPCGFAAMANGLFANPCGIAAPPGPSPALTVAPPSGASPEENMLRIVKAMGSTTEVDRDYRCEKFDLVWDLSIEISTSLNKIRHFSPSFAAIAPSVLSMRCPWDSKHTGGVHERHTLHHPSDSPRHSRR